MDYGIDVSGWNEVGNWHAVRSNNISFASIKTTQGDYYTSPAAAGQFAGARAAGVAAGAYHFADSGVPIDRQIGHFVNKSRALGAFDQGALAPMLDLEDSPGDGIRWNAGSANAFVAGFIHRLRNATGVGQVLVYASLSVWQSMLRPDEWADDRVFLWIALYNGDPGNVRGYNHRRAALHQHTQEGNVPGVSGYVDRNVTLGSFSTASMVIGNVAPPAPGPAPRPEPTPGGWVDYMIKAGDTLSGIAGARGIGVDELARINSIGNPNLIYAGQVIRVPGGGAAAPSTGHYRVQPGDTLAAIAQRFGTTVQALAAANGISNPDLIFAGQWLDVPAAGGGAPTPGPDRTYTVKPGDSLSAIAQRLGTTVGHLVSVNGIANADLIFPGQVLRY